MALYKCFYYYYYYSLYSAKRTTLDSVSQLFAIACKLFPELDKTGEVRIKNMSFRGFVKLKKIQKSKIKRDRAHPTFPGVIFTA